MTERRLTLQDAAQELGITPDALRQRIRRGQYHATKEEGRVYVYLNLDRTETEHDVQVESNALISEMRSRIESLERSHELLERQLEQANERDRENRRLLAAALERIPPQLEAPTEEAPSETRESPVPKTEGDSPTPEESPRPWWRRVFGG
jgi:predicted transcriptional regulator